MFPPDFGHPSRKKIPVEFTFYGQQLTGTLTEITGLKHGWFLHSGDLVDTLIWKGGVTWKNNTKELVKQNDYFLAVLIRWYG